MRCNQLRTADNRPMDHRDIKHALGFPHAYKYGPDEEWDKTAPDGTKLTLLSVSEAAVRANTGIGNGSHRLFAVCNICGVSVPAGRLHQHYKAH